MGSSKNKKWNVGARRVINYESTNWIFENWRAHFHHHLHLHLHHSVTLSLRRITCLHSAQPQRLSHPSLIHPYLIIATASEQCPKTTSHSPQPQRILWWIMTWAVLPFLILLGGHLWIQSQIHLKSTTPPPNPPTPRTIFLPNKNIIYPPSLLLLRC